MSFVMWGQETWGRTPIDFQREFPLQEQVELAQDHFFDVYRELRSTRESLVEKVSGIKQIDVDAVQSLVNVECARQTGLTTGIG